MRKFRMVLFAMGVAVGIALLVAGCSTTSAIPEGEQLYAGLKKIEYTNSEGGKHFTATQEEVEAALAAAPNGAFFGSSYYRTPLPWRLWLWNATEGKKGFAHWLNKTFTSYPTLMSDVNPAVRAQIAKTTLVNNGYFRGTVSYEEITKKNPKEGKIAYTISPNHLFTIDTLTYANFPSEMDTLVQGAKDESLLHVGDGFTTERLELERQRVSRLLRNNGYYYYQSGYASYLADTLARPGGVSLRLQMADSLDSRATRQWYLGATDVYLYRKGVKVTYDSIRHKDLTIHFNGRRPLMSPRVVLGSLRLRPHSLFSQEAYEESLNRLTGNENFSSIDFVFTPRDTLATCDTLDMAIHCMMSKPWDFSLEGKVTGKTSSRIGPGLELILSRRNLFRYGEKLSLDVYGNIEWQFGGGGGTNSNSKVNSYEYGVDLTLELPRLFPFKSRRRWYSSPSTIIKLSDEVINRGDYFNRNIVSAEYTWNFQPSATSKHEFSPIIIEYDHMNRTTERFDSILKDNPYLMMSMKDQFIPKMRYTYIYSSPATYRNPITWSVTLSEASNIISLFYMMAGRGWNEKDKNLIKNPYAQFLKLETDFTKTWRVSEHTDLVAHLSGGIIWAYGNSEDAPYSEQFYVGGANSIRAFTVRAIGPGRYHTNDAGLSYVDQTGDLKLVGNLEYRPRIFGSLYGAVFLDVGNIWKIRNDGYRGKDAMFHWNSLWRDVAVGTGVGLRYDLDFFVIRVDWGIGLHMPYDTGKHGFFNINKFWKSTSLHLAIGYPF